MKKLFNKKINLKKIILIPIAILSILSALVLTEEDPITPPFRSGGNEEQPPQFSYDSTLKIIEVITSVDGKKDTITNSGEKISKEAKQESDVEFEIELKNVWDKEIKNIEVIAKIEEIDDGEDIEDESIISKLSPGDSKKVVFDFNLPLKVDDGNYNVKINVEGMDQNNSIHKLNWGLTLEVRKEAHDVRITKASLSPSTIQCGGTTNLQVELLNLGREDEDVKIELKNSLLNLDFKETGIELDTGSDDDAEYEKTFRINIPANLNEGIYPITINVYYNNDESIDTKKVNLRVEYCKKVQQKQSEVSIKTLPPSTSETFEKSYQKPKTSGKTIISTSSDESIILLFSVILIVVLGLIIFLFGVIIIRLRR